MRVLGVQVGRPNDVNNPRKKVGFEATLDLTSSTGLTAHSSRAFFVGAGSGLQERERETDFGESGQ